MFRRRRVAPAVSAPAGFVPDGRDAAAGQPQPAENGGAAAPVAVSEDEALIRAAQAGNLDAFNQLVQRHERPVFNVALRLLRDVGLAEDATQDTFIRAWQAIGTFQTGSVRSWLYKIATNRAYDMLRASARRPAGSLEAEPVEIEPTWTAGGAGEESPDSHALRQELSIYLERALASLPGDQRTVVLLVDVQGLDYHEVADAMGIALGTVKSRLSRARAKVRQMLADDDEARELFARYLRLEGEDEEDQAGMPGSPSSEPDRMS
ncbi:MAG: sigma-70 family RNA polymerase sigma factor [Thermomicrobiales bacterium]